MVSVIVVMSVETVEACLPQATRALYHTPVVALPIYHVSFQSALIYGLSQNPICLRVYCMAPTIFSVIKDERVMQMHCFLVFLNKTMCIYVYMSIRVYVYI